LLHAKHALKFRGTCRGGRLALVFAAHFANFDAKPVKLQYCQYGYYRYCFHFCGLFLLLLAAMLPPNGCPMLIPDSLQTIAEISIAFAGFTGLVVAMRKNEGPLTPVQKYRLQILLSLAFGAMFLSLLPDLLQDHAIKSVAV
jgi:hypothetical protein